MGDNLYGTGQSENIGSINEMVDAISDANDDGGDEDTDQGGPYGEDVERGQGSTLYTESNPFDGTLPSQPQQYPSRPGGVAISAAPFSLDLSSLSWDQPEFYPQSPLAPYPVVTRGHSQVVAEELKSAGVPYRDLATSQEIREDGSARLSEDMSRRLVNPYVQPATSLPENSAIYLGQDNITRIGADGVEWMSFEYTRDRQAWTYNIRCDIDTVDESHLSKHFRDENCIYPKAMVPPEEYTGHRQRYETACNELGWRLAYLNPELLGRRGLIQRAVDSYRNSSKDISSRSRRARRLARRMARDSVR